MANKTTAPNGISLGAPFYTTAALYNNGYSLISQKWKVRADQIPTVTNAPLIYLLHGAFSQIEPSSIKVDLTSPGASYVWCTVKGDKTDTGNSTSALLDKYTSWNVGVFSTLKLDDKGKPLLMALGRITASDNSMFYVLEESGSSGGSVSVALPLASLENNSVMIRCQDMPSGPYFSIGIVPNYTVSKTVPANEFEIHMVYVTRAFNFQFIHDIKVEGYGDTHANWSVSAEVTSRLTTSALSQMMAMFHDQSYMVASTASGKYDPSSNSERNSYSNTQETLSYPTASYSSKSKRYATQGKRGAGGSGNPQILEIDNSSAEDATAEDDSSVIVKDDLKIEGDEGTKKWGFYGKYFKLDNAGGAFSRGVSMLPLEMGGGSSRIKCSYVMRWAPKDVDYKYRDFSAGGKNPLRLLRIADKLDNIVDGVLQIWIGPPKDDLAAGTTTPTSGLNASNQRFMEERQSGITRFNNSDKSFPIVEMVHGLENTLEVSLEHLGNMKNVNKKNSLVNFDYYNASYSICVKRKPRDTVPMILEVWFTPDFTVEEGRPDNDSQVAITNPPISSSVKKIDPKLVQIRFTVPERKNVDHKVYFTLSYKSLVSS